MRWSSMSGMVLLCEAVLLSCASPTRTLHEAPASAATWSARVDWPKAQDEAVEVLQRYLRIDTVNPPGNETRGAMFFRDELLADGIEARIVEFAPGRGSLIARLPATSPSGEKPLCLLSHLDVVPAETETWPADAGPLSGVIVDGELWGRGALDMKGLGALELQTVRLLKRVGAPLKRDVLLLAVADEEVDEGGMKQLTETMWSELDCGHVLNEGGIGLRDAVTKGQTAYGISVGEKGILWAQLIAEGEAGHGSTPTDNRAPTRLAQAIELIRARTVTPRLHPSMYELLRRSGVHGGGAQGFVLQRPALVDSLVVKRLLEKPPTRAIITNTCQVTGYEGKGSAPNVIPSKASAWLDCRLLPGTTPAELQKELETLIAPVSGVRLEVVQSFEAAVSEFDDPFFDALARHAVMGQPHAIAGPVISPGYTDSILARGKGARAYGLTPFEVSADALGTMHGRNERVNVESVKRGLHVVFDAVLDVVVVP